MASAAFPMAVDLAVLRLGFDRVAVLVEMTIISAVTLMRPHLILPRRMVHAVMVCPLDAPMTGNPRQRAAQGESTKSPDLAVSDSRSSNARRSPTKSGS